MNNFLQVLKKNYIATILVVILMLAAFFRLYQLGYQSYWIDEGFTINAAISTLEKGLPILDSGFHYYRSILNTYTIALFIKIFGLTTVAVRLSTALLGIFMVFLTYKFANLVLKNKIIGLISAFFAAFAYFDIAWSRQARMYVEFQVFFYAALLMFYLLLQKYSLAKLFGVIVLTGLTIVSHEFGLLLIPIYLITYLIYYYGPFAQERLKTAFRNKFSRFISRYFWVIFVFSITVVPLAGIKLYALFLKRFLGYMTEGFTPGNGFVASQFLIWFFNSFPVLIIGALIGIILYIIKEKAIFPVVFLLSCFLFTFYCIIISTDLINFRYLFPLYIFIYIFDAVAIYYSYKLLVDSFKLKNEKVKFGLIVIMVIGFAVLSGNFVFWPHNKYWLETRTPQPEFQSAYQAIQKLGFNDNSKIISPYPALDKVYLGKSDYWFPVSLSGKVEEIENVKKSLYTGAPRVDDLDTLKTAGDHVFLVMDTMAVASVGREYLDYLKLTYQLRYVNKGVWVFDLTK